MSEQCHSTVGEKPLHADRAPHERVGVTGRKYWRSLEDLADTGEFRDWLEREFPNGASRLLESSRRTFLQLMGASLALAGVAAMPGCRRPDHKIYPYSKESPEETVPGRALYFATSYPMPGGGAEGFLVECHDNRPVKVEGNPLHPTNNGAVSAWGLATVLGLYNPDRVKDPVFVPAGAETPRSWDDFVAWARDHFAPYAASGGQGLAFLVDKRRSLSRDLVRRAIQSKYPQAMFVAYEPTECDAAAAGAAAAFGRPVRPVYDLSKADVIVTLDHDLFADDPDQLRHNRGWAAGRRGVTPGDPVNRMYAVESRYTITGAKADHRWTMAPSAIPAFAVALAREVLAGLGSGAAPLRAALDAVRIDAVQSPAIAAAGAVAKDLLSAKDGARRSGRTLIVAGASQPAAVHALCHALNAALGNLGSTVTLQAVSETEAEPSAAGLRTLVRALDAGVVTTLVTLNANPVYDAPADLDFAAAFARCPVRVTASCDDNETIAASTWQLPLSHAFESWGDTVAHDGTVAPIQPLIAPLYGSKSDLEILAICAGETNPDGYEITRAAFRERLGAGFDKAWRRALHDGVFGPTEPVEADAAGVAPRAAEAVSRMPAPSVPTAEAVDVVFTMGSVADGRFANHGWLQELPDPITKVVWDNVALISPATARAFGLDQDDETTKKAEARMIALSLNGRRVAVPAWRVPGVADNTVVLQVGYGRAVCGSVGTGVGFNVFPLSGLGGADRRFVAGAKLERVGEGPRSHKISSTQTHGSMEGRAIVREVDVPVWDKFGAEVQKKEDHYGFTETLPFGERLGELSHTPANVNSYVNPQRGTKLPPESPGVLRDPRSLAAKNELNVPPDFARGPQWGMTIDQNVCTGCSACMIACQAENNVPIVGKTEVNKGREMHWLRIDRYFGGQGGEDPELGVMFQPMLCVHCENAPCETVCPVNATVHGPEGINYMVYNRCIGTRYCANNCPYKVRRYNFFEFGQRKYNGDFIGRKTLEKTVGAPENENLVPARLRQRLDEVTKLHMNPDVTVRSRGVMEKCSLCIQRINEARIEVKLQNLPAIPDGFVQTACQQSCPTGAIVFGDLYDTESVYTDPDGSQRTGSRVSATRRNARNYAVLGFLNTRPRVTHLVSLKNPNPELADAHRRAAWEHPFDHGHGGHDGEGVHGNEAESPGHGAPAPAHAPEAHGLNTFDSDRADTDAGYKLSLAVLGAHA